VPCFGETGTFCKTPETQRQLLCNAQLPGTERREDPKGPCLLEDCEGKATQCSHPSSSPGPGHLCSASRCVLNPSTVQELGRTQKKNTLDDLLLHLSSTMGSSQVQLCEIGKTACFALRNYLGSTKTTLTAARMKAQNPIFCDCVFPLHIWGNLDSNKYDFGCSKNIRPNSRSPPQIPPSPRPELWLVGGCPMSPGQVVPGSLAGPHNYS
jgi:hypothetical protein